MADHERANILVVDDKHDNLVAIEALLESPKQSVVRASSGRDALRHILRQEFAVILLDINMPVMDGFETAELIRQRKSSKHTPIIFLTAQGDNLHLARSYSLGAVDYIMTPVIPDVLRAKVAVFVELFSKTAEVRRQAATLQRRAAQLHKLTAASLAINAALSLDAMIHAITEAAREVVEAHQAVTVVELGHPGERPHMALSLSEQYATFRGRSPISRIGGPDPPGAGELFRPDNAPLRKTRSELAVDPRRGDGDPSRPPLRGVLAAPLTEALGQPMGYIELCDKIEGDFTEEDENILVQLAQLGSIAIQNCINAEAREANRLKDEFLATLSHELRTPLNTILGWTHLLRAEPFDAGKIARGLEVIERNVNAQARMVEDLLDVSRITTGKMLVTTRPLDLAPLIEEVIETHRPAAEAKGIRIAATIDRGAGLVHADPERIQQAISNVLGNAIKFTPRGGHADVLFARVHADVELRVSDSGEGINAEFLPFVFERFRQADSTLRRSQGGLGIGLAVVRHILELHGGSARAESTGSGHGATFILRLPAIAEAPIADAAPSGAAPCAVLPVLEGRGEPTGALEDLRILLVDDDADAREMLTEVLAMHRARVVAASSAREALDALTAAVPDVLVSDVAMPGGDGYELIRLIRNRKPHEGGQIPALALTAHARHEDQVRALNAGFQMHAAKPIEPDALVAAVARLAARDAQPEPAPARPTPVPPSEGQARDSRNVS